MAAPSARPRARATTTTTTLAAGTARRGAADLPAGRPCPATCSLWARRAAASEQGRADRPRFRDGAGAVPARPLGAQPARRLEARRPSAVPWPRRRSHEASPSTAGGGGSSGATPAAPAAPHAAAVGALRGSPRPAAAAAGDGGAPAVTRDRGGSGQSSLETADTPAASGLDALRRAAERAQLLQAMAMQQFGELETTHTAQSGPDAASEVARLRAMVQSRDEKIEP